jgi:hypothetical protein
MEFSLRASFSNGWRIDGIGVGLVVMERRKHFPCRPSESVTSLTEILLHINSELFVYIKSVL